MVFIFKLEKTSLNKLRWSKDGTKIIVGDAIGKISIYDIDKNVILYFI